jgi:hypothetical protein
MSDDDFTKRLAVKHRRLLAGAGHIPLPPRPWIERSIRPMTPREAGWDGVRYGLIAGAVFSQQ